MAKLVRLTTKAELARRDRAAYLRKQLLLYPEDELPPRPRTAILHALQRTIEPHASVWVGGYAMISMQQTGVVWDAIRALPPRDRPQKVRHAFDLVLLNLSFDTGEVMLTMEELTAQMKCAPQHASSAMNLLFRMGVLLKEWQKIPGMRGPGRRVWFINPHVAWNGKLETRQEQAIPGTQPSLHLVPAE